MKIKINRPQKKKKTKNNLITHHTLLLSYFRSFAQCGASAQINHPKNYIYIDINCNKCLKRGSLYASGTLKRQ